MARSFNYEQFRHKIADVPLRTTQYYLYIENNSSQDIESSIGFLENMRDIGLTYKSPSEKSPRKFFSEFHITALSFPIRYAGVIPIEFQGRQIRFAGNGGLYDPLTFMVYENSNCDGLNFFNKWCEDIQNMRSGLSRASTGVMSFLYTKQAYFVAYTHDRVNVFKFTNAFPLLFGPAEFNWEQESVVAFPVHLNFENVEFIGNFMKGSSEFDLYTKLYFNA